MAPSEAIAAACRRVLPFRPARPVLVLDRSRHSPKRDASDGGFKNAGRRPSSKGDAGWDDRAKRGRASEARSRRGRSPQEAVLTLGSGFARFAFRLDPASRLVHRPAAKGRGIGVYRLGGSDHHRKRESSRVRLSPRKGSDHHRNRVQLSPPRICQRGSDYHRLKAQKGSDYHRSHDLAGGSDYHHPRRGPIITGTPGGPIITGCGGGLIITTIKGVRLSPAPLALSLCGAKALGGNGIDCRGRFAEGHATTDHLDVCPRIDAQCLGERLPELLLEVGQRIRSDILLAELIL